MKETMSAPRQRRFLALAAAAAACIVGLALWYAVPPAPAQDVPASAPEALRESFRVNLNTAGVDAMTTLPGLGEKKARAILKYRTVMVMPLVTCISRSDRADISSSVKMRLVTRSVRCFSAASCSS